VQAELLSNGLGSEENQSFEGIGIVPSSQEIEPHDDSDAI
jgi:hypothetical protein